jgi:phosphoribosylamine---glycine ligase
MVFGIGAFTQGVMRCLREDGARVSAYLTRDYGHHGPSLEGRVYDGGREGDPFRALDRERPEFVVPMSIEWALQPWTRGFVDRRVPILCPSGEGLLLERDRDYARVLCGRYGIPFPESHRVKDRVAARQLLARRRRAFVIKNPLCSPFSPVHTIVCETAEETRAWVEGVDDGEGLFLQEYLGRAEAGHIALVSGGEIYSLVTNQEYKRAFDGDLGIVAGAPLGGVVERDPGDRYGLARALLHPLRPWFREVGYCGPVQVTAIRHGGRWQVLEFNVRLGVTSGMMILRLVENPLEVLRDAALNRALEVRWRRGLRYGVLVTLAGYGYPYVRLAGPRLPVMVRGDLGCDVWWNEVARGRGGRLVMTGHRLAEVAAVGPTLGAARRKAYENVRRIHCLGSYYRLDIGRCLWPPGVVNRHDAS